MAPWGFAGNLFEIKSSPAGEAQVHPIDGFYRVAFIGEAGWGAALMVLRDGLVVGADSAGGAYDGVFYADPPRRRVVLDVSVTIPAGVSLVQGIPAQPHPFTFKIAAELPDKLDVDEVVASVHTPYGPVQASIKRLRGLPRTRALPI